MSLAACRRLPSLGAAASVSPVSFAISASTIRSISSTSCNVSISSGLTAFTGGDGGALVDKMGQIS